MTAQKIESLMQEYLSEFIDDDSVSNYPELAFFCIKNDISKEQIPVELLEVFYNFQLSYLNTRSLRGLVIPAVALKFRQEIMRELKEISLIKNASKNKDGESPNTLDSLQQDSIAQLRKTLSP